MGFTLAKMLLLLVVPPSGMLVLMAGGLIMRRWHRTAGLSLVALGAFLLYAVSLAPVSGMLIRPLESYAPPFSGTTARVDAVVVLGSGVTDLSWVPAPPSPSATALERLTAGIEIARRLKVPLAVSGGTGEVDGSDIREADAMADAAVRLGFPRRSIIVDNSSRNTLENARSVGRLLSGRTIVLATSAYHMRRAAAMFRRQGFTVIPAPAGYRSRSFAPSWADLIPRASALAVSSLAVSERLSLAWYGMRGTL
jgi:uncharacterized SAM-binding protein YcdF (DUF218 family)